jgi:hypothetical protein
MSTVANINEVLDGHVSLGVELPQTTPRHRRLPDPYSRPTTRHTHYHLTERSHHRHHTAVGGPPASRVNNLVGHNIDPPPDRVTDPAWRAREHLVSSDAVPTRGLECGRQRIVQESRIRASSESQAAIRERLRPLPHRRYTSSRPGERSCALKGRSSVPSAAADGWLTEVNVRATNRAANSGLLDGRERTGWTTGPRGPQVTALQDTPWTVLVGLLIRRR